MNKYIKYIYYDLLELSSIEVQSIYWLGKDPNKASSYIELNCRLFDDNSFDDFIDNQSSKIFNDENIIMELKKLRLMLRGYIAKETDEEIIKDPEWLKIVLQARKIIEKWKPSIDENRIN